MWAAYSNCTLSTEFTPEKTTWIAASEFPLWKLYGSCKLLHTLENSNSPAARLCLGLSAHLSHPEALRATKSLRDASSWCSNSFFCLTEEWNKTLPLALWTKIAEEQGIQSHQVQEDLFIRHNKTKFWSFTTASLNESQWTKVCNLGRPDPWARINQLKERKGAEIECSFASKLGNWQISKILGRVKKPKNPHVGISFSFFLYTPPVSEFKSYGFFFL